MGNIENIIKVFFIIFGFVFVGTILYNVVQHFSYMEKAKQIDPTVRTKAEADIVIKKHIAQNVGNKTDNKEDSAVFCKHCGKNIPTDSKFCKSCGKEQ